MTLEANHGSVCTSGFAHAMWNAMSPTYTSSRRHVSNSAIVSEAGADQRCWVKTSPAMLRVSTHGPPDTGTEIRNQRRLDVSTKRREHTSDPALPKESDLEHHRRCQNRPCLQPNTAFSKSLINRYYICIYIYIYTCMVGHVSRDAGLLLCSLSRQMP